MSELIEKIAACRACGQTKWFKIPEDMSDEDLEEKATLECNCKAGIDYRAKAEEKKRIEDIITSTRGLNFELFNEEYPEVEKIFNDCLKPMTEGKFKSISIQIDAETKAKLKYRDKKFDVERTDTAKQGGTIAY